MKKTLALTIAAATLALTGCASEPTFTDEQLEEARRVNELFTHDDDTPTPEEATRQIETQRYHDIITPRWDNPHEGWKTSYGTNPLTLEESINICEDLRVNLESTYLIQNADTEVTDRDQYLNYAGLIHDEMCELD